MHKINKLIDLVDFKELIYEVKVIGKDNHEPLRDSDTVLLYHGANSAELVYNWISNGFTGDIKANRTYSYEFNNNPKGLFVTPDLSTAKEFGTLIIEFHAKVENLESPVWPNGTFTGQGQQSGIFKNSDEREQERLRTRELASKSDDDFIRNSDRPELASILIQGGERQALFTGDVNPSSIHAVWVKNDTEKAKSPYTRLKRSEFIKAYADGKFENFRFKKFNMKDYDVEGKAVKPREFLSGEEFVQRVISLYPERMRKILTVEKVVGIFKKDEQAFHEFVWSDRQFKHYKNEIEKM